MTSKYKTSFIRGRGGNVLEKGTDLTIKIAGSPVYIIGRLFRRTSRGMTMIQIEQSGSRQNPRKGQIKFEMKVRERGRIKPMPAGKYRVSTYAYFKNLGGKRWGDSFEIVDV